MEKLKKGLFFSLMEINPKQYCIVIIEEKMLHKLIANFFL
jgi:hypothetical protein